jgi:hypothetical protein
MTGPLDTPARNSKTGRHPSANPTENVKQPAPALFNYWIDRMEHKPQRRLTPEDIHARLILIIGGTLAATFFVLVVGAVWALVFVTQPMKQAPNDAAFIDLLKTLAIFLTGSLGGVLAGNGLKSKPKDKDTPGK